MPTSFATWPKRAAVVESGLAALHADQRERLVALGYELLSLRSTAVRPAAASESHAPMRTTTTSEPCKRLVMKVASGDLLVGPQSALLRAVIAALGLNTSEVSQEDIAGLPTVAFGPQADTPAIPAPAPEQLRNARAKRALWPLLRRLRRQLQTTSHYE